jgi:PD-(D/E)XK nuclease superfamily
MAWAYVIRSSDRKMFKCCRRAWDLGSRSRQNYEPVQPTQAFDFDKAMHEALALYYFPGMWEWNREVVIPMVLEGFIRSMREQRDRCLKRRAFSAEEEQAWNEHLEIGESILVHYSEWAPATDRFEPIRVAPDFEVNIPDPTLPGQDLVAPDSTPVVPIRYRGRFDALAMDGHDAYWIIEHRIGEAFADLDLLLLDEQSVAACWAWQIFCPGMRIAGVIYNELRKAVPVRLGATALPARSVLTQQGALKRRTPPAQLRGLYRKAVQEPEKRIEQQGNEFFRRTQIARSQNELESAGRQIALEVFEIADPQLRLYPNPVWENCSRCDYRQPCKAMYEGTDAAAILATSYRKRSDDEFEPGRLGGSTWSMDRGAIPPKFEKEK